MELERDGLGKSTGCSCRGQGFTAPGSSHLTVIPVPEDLMSFSGFHGHQALVWCTDIYANKKPYPLNDENVGSGAQVTKAGGSQL